MMRGGKEAATRESTDLQRAGQHMKSTVNSTAMEKNGSMEKWKKIGRRLLFLPFWMLLLLTVVSAAALTAVFVWGREETPAAYAIYVLSFYTLTTVCLACWKTFPGYYRNTRQRVYDNRYANRYLTDVAYQTRVGLGVSLAVNLLYIGINVASAVYYRTRWFAIFAIYYGIMALMRLLLVWYVRKMPIGTNRLGELRRARTCAILLMAINLILSGVVLMMVCFDRGFQYRGVLIYVMALHAFYTTAVAIRDIVRYRRYRSPVLSVSKIIKLTAALFSMLFLETAMFAQFGQDTPEETKKLMIMLTGGGISVIVVAMSVYIIVRATGEIRTETKGE